jgi:hypothetical protein
LKKAILIVAALILVVSGVAAVSAYEAHTINVKAHVENALWVDTTEVDFGTVFPEEFIKYHREIRLSDSARAELGDAVGELESVTIQVYAEWKPIPQDPAPDPYPMPFVEDIDGNDYYAWMGECLYVGFDPSQDPGPLDGLTWVGPALDGPQSAQPVLATKILNAQSMSTQLGIAIDAPVFRGYYNMYTDVPLKPNGMDHPTWIIEENDYRYYPDGVDLGIDLKIQVIDIARVLPAPPAP